MKIWPIEEGLKNDRESALNQIRLLLEACMLGNTKELETWGEGLAIYHRYDKPDLTIYLTSLLLSEIISNGPSPSLVYALSFSSEPLVAITLERVAKISTNKELLRQLPKSYVEKENLMDFWSKEP